MNGPTAPPPLTIGALAASEERDCIEARDIAQIHLDAVRSKLSELQALERSLSRFVTACTEQCAGGPAPRCTILKDLGTGAGAGLDADPAPAGRCCG